MAMAGNAFQNKVTILAELWMNYRDDEQLKDFIEYNDLGLPMAYFLMNDLLLPTKQSEIYINETYDLLLASLEVDDVDYESLDELLGAIENE
jgi:hypothetical protein